MSRIARGRQVLDAPLGLTIFQEISQGCFDSILLALDRETLSSSSEYNTNERKYEHHLRICTQGRHGLRVEKVEVSNLIRQIVKFRRTDFIGQLLRKVAKMNYSYTIYYLYFKELLLADVTDDKELTVECVRDYIDEATTPEALSRLLYPGLDKDVFRALCQSIVTIVKNYDDRKSAIRALLPVYLKDIVSSDVMEYVAVKYV